MTEEYSYDYARWLEDSLINILTNGKSLSNEKLTKKLKVKGIKCHDEFVKCLDKINNRHKIIEKLPLLDTYPIDLSSDIYEEDIEKINEWEIDILTKLTMKLEKQYKSITPDIYYNFFDKEIKPYKEYFLEETYQKALPKNMERYWCRRIDRSISWGESAYSNIELDTTSPFEGGYFKRENDIFSYERLLNIYPKEY
ncbi:MAG: hypothetical protein K1W41_14505 [Lachnospiraceae bacterium]